MSAPNVFALPVGTDVSMHCGFPPGTAEIALHPYSAPEDAGTKFVHFLIDGEHPHRYFPESAWNFRLPDHVVPGGLIDAPPDGPNAAAQAYDAEFLSRDELGSLPTPEPLIEGVLARHSYGIVRGRDHSFKTFLALDWALCLATGTSWQGHPTERVKVLLMAGEGAYGMNPRVDAWEEATGVEVEPDMFTIRKSALNMFKPDASFQHLIERTRRDQYGLIIVDTLRRVSGSADGNGSEMGAVVDNIDRLKRATLNGTVLVVAHTDKGDNDSRGYSGIEDDADIVWHVKRDQMNVSAKNTKQKDGPDGQTINLRARQVGESLVLEAGLGVVAETTTESQGRILQTMLNGFRDVVASSSELKEASGVPKTTFHTAVQELVEGGFLIRTKQGQRYLYSLPVKEDGAA